MQSKKWKQGFFILKDFFCDGDDGFGLAGGMVVVW